MILGWEKERGKGQVMVSSGKTGKGRCGKEGRYY